MTHKITVAFSSLKLFLHLILTDLAREAMKLNFQYNFYVIWFPRNKVIIQIEFLDWLDMRSLIHTFVPSLNIMNYFLIWNFIMTVWEKKVHKFNIKLHSIMQHIKQTESFWSFTKSILLFAKILTKEWYWIISFVVRALPVASFVKKPK